MSTKLPFTDETNMLKRKAVVKEESSPPAKKVATTEPSTAAPYKLKSVPARTMTTENAIMAVVECGKNKEIQQKLIKQKKAEIRKLKKQMKAAEKAIADAEVEERSLGSKLPALEDQTRSDVDRIMSKAKAGVTISTGANVVEDMCALVKRGDATATDWADLTTSIGAALPLKSLQEGALQWLLNTTELDPEQQHAAIKSIYAPLLQNSDAKPISLHLILAAAVTLSGSEADIKMFVNSALEKAEAIKKNDPSKYGYYSAMDDTCPILDFLYPIWKNMSKGKDLVRVAEEIKKLLLESVNAIEAGPTNYSMPAEAETARKRNFSNIAAFLLSPTEATLELNLSKAGRMDVHRLIDNAIRSSRIRHSSVGTGRDRYLVLTKSIGAPVAQTAARVARKAKHQKLLKEEFA